MLGPGRYLLGALEIALLVGFAWLGAARARAGLLPRFAGAPAHLASAVIALALLIWVAEVLGTVGLFEPLPYLFGIALLGIALRLGIASADAPAAAPGPSLVPTAIALAVAAIAIAHFAAGVKTRLSTGMTGFDSTWYHGPFAAEFFQSGNTLDLRFIAPQFLAWFYPANGEIFHAAGMLAFGRDILSPLLNLGWFAGCLLACWCIGRPYRVAPWSLGLGAIALSLPALSDQAGEARNDIVGIFFLLAAVAIAANAWAARGEEERSLPTGSLIAIGLAAGLAAGAKLNFLLPAGVLVLGLVAIAAGGTRLRALAAAGLAALAGGGYWYLRNLVHTGNPLPWIDGLGPISLPAPDQALGGREAHSVLGYLADGAVWSEWFLPGLRDGLWFVWPLLVVAALAGLVLCLDWRASPADDSPAARGTRRGRLAEADPVLPLAGLVGLATALAWLVAPTSASGPDGMPRGFESGLRYLAPALVLGLALLPATPLARRLSSRSPNRRSSFVGNRPTKDERRRGRRRWAFPGALLLLLLAIGAGNPVQRHYLESRYADPSFTTPGLNAAFAWSRDVSDARIATTSTRQYPLFGADLSNEVRFVGVERPHGGFQAPSSCQQWRRELNKGDYDYVVASRDRIEPGKSPYPRQARWTEGFAAKPILKTPPTVVFKLAGTLDPLACPH